MPNVLDTDPIQAFACRAAERIDDAAIRGRFIRLAFANLMADSRNFRPASPTELAAAPDWAHKAIARGETVSVFELCHSARMRIHSVARRVAHTRQLAAIDVDANPSQTAAAFMAQGFLDKFDRISFEVMARKAGYYARIYDNADCDQDTKAMCAPQSVLCANSAVWRRITSIAELRAVGREFCNCLARATRASAYGRKLMRGSAQFWVLRDQGGAGLFVAQAPGTSPQFFTEVRGPRNAVVNIHHPEFTRLACAIGIQRNDPPPPASAVNSSAQRAAA